MILAKSIFAAGFLVFLTSATCSVIRDASATGELDDLNACRMEVTELKAELREEMEYNIANERILRQLVDECKAEED